MKDIKFSIILPIYNVDEFLEQCIKSLLEQTYENYEIFLIDDGSQDHSAEICKKYISDKVHYVYQKNSGVSVARNKGIEMSTGNWIVFVDPDDWVENNFLQTFYDNIDNKTDIILCDDFVEFPNKQILNNIYQKDFTFKTSNEKDDLIIQFFSKNGCKYFPQYHDCSAPWGKAFKKELITDNNLIFEKELRRAQDKIFNLYAFEYSKCIKYCQIATYHYRMNENSTWGKFSPNIENDLKKLYKHMNEYIEKYKKNDKNFQQFFYEKITLSINSIFRQYYYNTKYTENKKKKYNDINRLINDEPFNSAIKNINKKKLSIQEKIFVYFLKKRQYDMCGLLINMRRKFLSGR